MVVHIYFFVTQRELRWCHDGLDEDGLEEIIAREVDERMSGVEVDQTNLRNQRSNP